MQLNFIEEIFSEIFNSSTSFLFHCKSSEYDDFNEDNIFANPQFKNVILCLLIFIFFNLQIISYLLECYHNNMGNIRNLPLDDVEPDHENQREDVKEWKLFTWKLIRGNGEYNQVQNNPPIQ